LSLTSLEANSHPSEMVPMWLEKSTQMEPTRYLMLMEYT